MTKADDAYAEAERRINAAREIEAVTLDLSGLHALSRVPPAIKSLHDLRTLFLWGTNVTDLTPLAPLPELSTLDLSLTNVVSLVARVVRDDGELMQTKTASLRSAWPAFARVCLRILSHGLCIPAFRSPWRRPRSPALAMRWSETRGLSRR